MTHFDAIGGMDGLTAILDDFYDRVFADAMIGFMFADADKRRLVAKEAEFTAGFLGAKNVKYSGLSMPDAHRRHRIFGGQFLRRRTLLAETLRDHDVPEAAAAAWLEHTDRLRPLVTADPGSECATTDEGTPAPPARERHVTVKFD